MTAEIISGTDAWRSKKGLDLLEIAIPARETLSQYLQRKPLGGAPTASSWPKISMSK